MNGLLADQVAIVTGGASGIGRATVQRFVEQGARVIVGDIDVEQGEQLAREIGPAALFVKADVACADQVQGLVDAAIEHFGDLHVMFNNAGLCGAVHHSFLDDDFADFSQLMEVNLLGAMLGSQRAARYMRTRQRGSIINCASVGALKAGLPVVTYRAAKAGLIHLTKCIARELGHYGIRVNCLAPGHIPAGMTFYDMEAMVRQMQPLPRQGHPADAANAALFLASKLSAQITGAMIPIDGGSHLGGPLEKIPMPAN